MSWQFEFYVFIQLHIRSSNPSVHTQSNEGTWFRIKRWLPSSGRYNLSYYLPVYLWHCDCLRRGVNPFWDLLDIVSRAEGDKLFGLKMDSFEEQVNSTSREILILILRNNCLGWSYNSCSWCYHSLLILWQGVQRGERSKQASEGLPIQRVACKVYNSDLVICAWSIHQILIYCIL